MQPPVRLNNPFYYEPDALCQLAIAQLAAYLRGDKEQTFAKDAVDASFQAEIAKGKMFGVVAVRQDGELGYIAGYSGQIVGRSDWPDFVPAVYDYLQPNGYFKTHEAEISDINKRIHDMERGQDLYEAHQQLETVKVRQEQAIQDFKACHHSGAGVGESNEEYIRRRQFENAELHRLRKDYRVQVEQALSAVDELERALRRLRQQRRQKSDNLQSWLFRQFRLRNARGEVKDIEEIFHDYGQQQG